MQRASVTPSVSSHRESFPEVSALFQLLKPITWFPPMWAFLCGAVSSGNSILEQPLLLVLGLVLTGPLVCGASQVVNDWFDREVDALNEPDRPIPSGRVPGHWGLYFAIAWSLLSLAWAALLGTWVLVATALALVLAWAYSAPPLRLKLNGWWGNAAVGFSYEGLAWVTGAAVLLGGQFPGPADENTSSFGDRLSTLVFGKKPREVIKPFNVLAADPGHYWILDQGAGGVFEVQDGEGELIRSMKRASQDYPSLVGLSETCSGDILFTDSRLNRIMRMTGGQLSPFAESLGLNQPTGIACNPVSGEIWVVETGAHRISVINKDGEQIRTIGGRGTIPGLFNYPTFIWIDAGGRVYVVDSMNFRVQVLNEQGQVEFSFGEPGDATGNMARPKGIATDSKGHIYVADALFHAVQIFDDQGNFLHSFGSQGQQEGEFWMPSGLYIDDGDHIYVADSYNGRIQIFELVKN